MIYMGIDAIGLEHDPQTSGHKVHSSVIRMGCRSLVPEDFRETIKLRKTIGKPIGKW